MAWQAVRVALVVLVPPVPGSRSPAPPRKKSFHHAAASSAALSSADVALDLGLAGVRDRRHAHCSSAVAPAVAGGPLARRVSLNSGKRARSARAQKDGAGLHRPALEAAQALERVLRPADRLAEFAVARVSMPTSGLPRHDLENEFLKPILVARSS